MPQSLKIQKALSLEQGKEETPTECLERLKSQLQKCGHLDLDNPGHQMILKYQFVGKAWEDIRIKLQKLDTWETKTIEDLLREDQKVYTKREEERAKRKIKTMAQLVQTDQQTGQGGVIRKPIRGLRRGLGQG